MKRVIYFFLLAATIVATGCSNGSNNPLPTSAAPIKGHTYKYTYGTEYISFYFSKTNTAQYISNMDGNYFATSNLTYKIDRMNVDVYADYSNTWTESARGTILFHLTYLATQDILVFDGAQFKRVD